MDVVGDDPSWKGIVVRLFLDRNPEKVLSGSSGQAVVSDKVMISGWLHVLLGDLDGDVLSRLP